MNWSKVHIFISSEYFLLTLILALAFYMAYIPHLNYPYPLHLDEWIHFADITQIIREGNAFSTIDPFSGGTPSINQIYEVGFLLPFSIFHQISGLPLMDIFRYTPAIMFMVTVASVYILARKQRVGWSAALMTCLIPTSLGVLGPAFMVPLAMGLMFIPIVLFINLNFRNIGSYLTQFIIFLFLVTLHGPLSLTLIIILIPYIILNFKKDRRHSTLTIAAISAPFLTFLFWTWNMSLSRWESLFTQHELKYFVSYPQLFSMYGYSFLVVCLVGVYVMSRKWNKQSFGLILGLLAILLMLAVFSTFQFGIPIIYERGFVPAMLMISIVTGAGLMGIRSIKIPHRLSALTRMPTIISKNAGNIICIVVLGIILFTIIPTRLNARYYQPTAAKGTASITK